MKKCSILIADDNFDDQKMIKDALLHCNPNCEINYVFNGNQLLDYVLQKGRYRQNTTLPEGIILDLRMPFLDGFGVLEAFNSNSVSVPVYILTGVSSRKDNARCVKAGARAFYEKPEDPGEFRTIMKDILNDIQKKKES